MQKIHAAHRETANLSIPYAKYIPHFMNVNQITDWCVPNQSTHDRVDGIAMLDIVCAGAFVDDTRGCISLQSAKETKDRKNESILVQHLFLKCTSRKFYANMGQGLC